MNSFEIPDSFKSDLGKFLKTFKPVSSNAPINTLVGTLNDGTRVQYKHIDYSDDIMLFVQEAQTGESETYHIDEDISDYVVTRLVIDCNWPTKQAQQTQDFINNYLSTTK